MVKIYTRKGDSGQTSLVSGKRVPKAALRLNAYGTVDELNSIIGMAIAFLTKSEKKDQIFPILSRIQNELFNLGSHLACDDDIISQKLPPINKTHIQNLESDIDELNKPLPELKNFILPGGSQSASIIHLARTTCRRAEREVCRLAEIEKLQSGCMSYLNRLSDFLFVLSRFINFSAAIHEEEWKK